MKRLVVLTVLFGTLLVAGASAAPLTKQNGRSPASTRFTSICAVPGFAGYGFCNGDTSQFANVTGRINAVQPKAGVWNLDLSFANLEPGVAYTLWGNRSGAMPSVEPRIVSGFFEIATAVADASGSVSFSYQTTDPVDLGFDLNASGPNVTVVTSWWSVQWLEKNPDGTLYARQG